MFIVKNKVILQNIEHDHLVHSQLHLKDNKHALNTIAHSQNSNKSISGVSQGGIPNII